MWRDFLFQPENQVHSECTWPEEDTQGSSDWIHFSVIFSKWMSGANTKLFTENILSLAQVEITPCQTRWKEVEIHKENLQLKQKPLSLSSLMKPWSVYLCPPQTHVCHVMSCSITGWQKQTHWPDTISSQILSRFALMTRSVFWTVTSVLLIHPMRRAPHDEFTLHPQQIKTTHVSNKIHKCVQKGWFIGVALNRTKLLNAGSHKASWNIIFCQRSIKEHQLINYHVFGFHVVVPCDMLPAQNHSHGGSRGGFTIIQDGWLSYSLRHTIIIHLNPWLFFPNNGNMLPCIKIIMQTRSEGRKPVLGWAFCKNNTLEGAIIFYEHPDSCSGWLPIKCGQHSTHRSVLQVDPEHVGATTGALGRIQNTPAHGCGI